MFRIEFLIPAPPLIHNCIRGNCVRHAKYTVFQDDRKRENLCLHHAVKFCHQNGLHLPRKFEDQRMTEVDWLGSIDPTPMLEFLRGKTTDRKLRLFAAHSVGLAAEWLVHPDSKAAVVAAERIADGESMGEVLGQIRKAAWDVLPLLPDIDTHVSAARAAGRAVEESAFDAAFLTKNELVQIYAETLEEKAGSVDEKYRMYLIGKAEGERLLADLLRELIGNPVRKTVIDPDWLTVNVIEHARNIYDQRAFDRMPELTRALEQAGCTNPDILSHCRQSETHARGCWVVDLLLGKE